VASLRHIYAKAKIIAFRIVIIGKLDIRRDTRDGNPAAGF
jgi:hypothetical protein